jgi:hypothetical protein
MANPQALNPLGLFVPATNSEPIRPGSLISFKYPASLAKVPTAIHDPSPMVIITDIRPTYIRGVNLHYLTVPYIKEFLLRNAQNPGFNYAMSVKPDRYLADAFRMYYFKGMQQKRRLDMKFLMQLLTAVRSFSPTELERVRNELKQQIQSRLQIKAAELNTYTEWQKQQGKQQMQPPQMMQQPPTNPPLPELNANITDQNV